MADYPLIPITQNAIYCRNQARKMIQQTRAVWSEACDAMEELRLLRADLDGQIEELAKNDSFCRQYTSHLLMALLNAAVKSTRADMGNIQLCDPTASRLTIHVQQGFDRPFLEFFDSVHSGQAACGMALEAVQRVVVPDVTDSPVFGSPDILEVLLDARVRCVQSTPLVGESGSVLGMLSTHYRAAGKLAEGDLELIDHFARRAAAALEWQNRHTLCHAEDSGELPT